MIPAQLNIETYKGADHDIIIEVKDSDGNPFQFAGTNTLEIFRKFDKEPFIIINLEWDGTRYSGELSNADTDIAGTIYPFHWKVDNSGTISYPVKGDIAHSDVYTSNRVTVGTALTVSTVTNEVTVGDSFTAAAAAIEARDEVLAVAAPFAGMLSVISETDDYIEFIAIAPATVTEGSENITGAIGEPLEIETLEITTT